MIVLAGTLRMILSSLLLLYLNYAFIMSLPFVFFEKRDRGHAPKCGTSHSKRLAEGAREP